MASLKMLPIPVPIIRTKRLYIPLVYILAFLALCHIFITAFVSTKSQNNTNTTRLTIPSGKVTSNLRVEKTASRVYRSVLKSNSSNENVPRRSNSTEIWLGHQDQRIDMQSDQIQRWIGDPECANFAIHFARKHTFQPRALVSFPGSGNSWLRHLIESSTGFFTGSIYNDKALFRSGFFGEATSPNDGSTIVQKTHHFSTFFSSKQKLKAYVKLSELMFGYRGILLIRNPYEALLSFWNLYTTRTHMGHANKFSFSTTAWKLFVEKGAKVWADVTQEWIEKSMDLHVVLYEDLKAHGEKELLLILKYLKQPNDPARLKCVMKHDEGYFHRKQEKAIQNNTTNTICPFNNTDFSGNISLDLIVQNNIKKLNSFLQGYGFPLILNYTIPDCSY